MVPTSVSDLLLEDIGKPFNSHIKSAHQMIIRHRLSRRGDGHLRQVGGTRSAHASRDPLRDGGDLPRLAAEGQAGRAEALRGH